MLNCDGNENSKEKKQQQQHLWLANLGFRLIGHGGGGGGESTQQSVILADSALIVQSITI